MSPTALSERASPLASAPARELPPAPRRPLYRLVRRALYHVPFLLWRTWHALLHPEYPRAPRGVYRRMTRRFEALLERDLQNVALGLYPERLLRQFSWRDYAWGTALTEVRPILRRRKENGWHQLPAGVELERYPRYYRRAFHWQTDGWLSERSSRLYDLSVGFLFRGTTDATRRQALVPLVRALAGQEAPRVLDVACGNGRFLAQVQATLPRASLTGLDLSPFYLRHAKERVPGAEWAEGAAEEMPLPARSFDAVTSVYLFHELPHEVRRKVLAEMKRVLKPGGTLVLCDSIQQTDPDTQDIAYYLDWFPALYHEPYYAEYTRDDLGEMASQAGFEVLSSSTHYLSKLVVARAP